MPPLPKAAGVGVTADRHRRGWAQLLMLFACVACSSDPSIVTGDTEPAPKQVPDPLAVLASTSHCTTLAEGERLWAVSPEGHAWLADAAGTPSFRVLDPFDPAQEQVHEVAIGRLQLVRAFAAQDAAVVADDGLWRLDDLARVELSDPTGLTTGSLCGDPADNGMLLAEGSVYERRQGSWWRWDSESETSGRPSSIVAIDGECVDRNNYTWLMSSDGSLWRLEPSRYGKRRQFEANARAVATEDMVAVLESSRLMMGPDTWQPWEFVGPVPSDVSAAGGMLWLAADHRLIRFDGVDFVQVEHPLSSAIGQVRAHASGAWLVGGDQVCHVATVPMVRVQGVRPYARSLHQAHSFVVRANSGSTEITAAINGESLALSIDSNSGDLVGEVSLDVGWNTLSLELEGVTRRLPLKRVPATQRSWDHDVRPIYERHCAGGNCHGGTEEGPPELGDHEAWMDAAKALQKRVVDTQTMPPPSAKGADWSEEYVAIIGDWLQGGMLP